MHLAPRITIRDLPPSEAIKSNIENKIVKITKICDRIMHLDVIVEHAQKNKAKGKLFNAKLIITVPGEELNVNHAVNEDVYVAIRDAFNAAQRKLKTYTRRKRLAIKQHPISQHGIIERLFPEGGYGFIQANGMDYYFTEMNLVDTNFEDLKPYVHVHFIEVMADDGPQAHRISIRRGQLNGNEEKRIF